nr:hypothetical protein [Tanacetum cinerariifolium]
MHPPSPDYVAGPEHPLSPDYVPGRKQGNEMYSTFNSGDRPLLATVSLTADLPGYITESDPEEDPEEEDDEDPEEDPVDYPTDRDDEEEEEESSGDDADDEEEDEDDDEEEEHLVPTDFVPPPVYHNTARMTIRAQIFIPLPPEAERFCIAIGPRFEVEKCLSAPTARLIGGFRVDYGFVGTLDAEIRRDPDREIGYGITNVWEDPDEIAEEIPTTDVAELSQRMTDFVTTVRQDTDEIYGRLSCDADKSQNGEDSHDSGTSVRRQAPLAHECTYPDFMKCKPLYFKGTEGVFELTQWFERM